MITTANPGVFVADQWLTKWEKVADFPPQN
jgi:hypothetical protein